MFSVDDGLIPTCKEPLTIQEKSILIKPRGVYKQLQNLDSKKGPGPDGLSPALLKFLSDYIYRSLSAIFQYSINLGSVPQDWRDANVVPIYKKGSRSDPLNYRPISLTSIASKILEHIICHDVNSFLDDNNLLANCQHGFRKEHGCDTQLLSTLSDLVDHYDRNTPIDIAVLDFQKAFDVVPHQKLILKLRATGIHNQTCKWIESWLSDRRLAVTVNGASSSRRHASSGVLQGSVLGPLLFLIYINDMPNSVLNSSLRLFADDSLIYKPISSPSDTASFQADLDRLHDWSLTWQMKFNIAKCEFMRISRPSLNPPSLPTYYLNGCNLTYTTHVKYLGIYIDQFLSFDRQITTMCRKATGVLHMLMRSLKKAKTKTRSLAYKTICRPILEYGSQSWAPHKEKHIKLIEAINRKAFRWAFSKKKYDEISVHMIENIWPTLLERRRFADLNLYFKARSGNAKVDDDKIEIHHDSDYNTRTGGVRGIINTNVKRHYFQQRIHNYLNPLYGPND